MIELTPESQEPILIVDDNTNNLKVLAQSLRSAGWIVAIAKNGETALKQAVHTPPALILLDVMMPGIDGFETCQRLKANPDTMAIPIIFMTALSDTVDKVKGLSIGAVDYITKPFQAEEVLARVSVHYKLSSLSKYLEYHNKTLERRVAARTAQIEKILQELKQAQIQVVKQEKMAALGNLIAGVAHEINNPVGFIGGNISIAREHITDLLYAIKLYQHEIGQASPEFTAEIEGLELDFIAEDFPQIIDSMQEGVDRISNISTSLRTFSRADTVAKTSFNLHEGIDSTLLILKYRLKANNRRPEIMVIKNYGNLPLLNCYPGQINQVFMNLLANAIDALEEVSEGLYYEEIKANPNTINITTAVEHGNIVVRIRDNAKGMSEEVIARIFDSSFTTKAVGKGTGLGLAISRQIVEEKHGGNISCTSELGKGTEFAIALPIS